MAFFKNDPREWERLDWRLLQNGAVALYHRPAVLGEDVAWLQSQVEGEKPWQGVAALNLARILQPK